MNRKAGGAGAAGAPGGPPSGRDTRQLRWRSERPLLLGVLLTLLFHLPLLLVGRSLARRPAPPVEVVVSLPVLAPADNAGWLAQARRLAARPPRARRALPRPRPQPAVAPALAAPPGPPPPGPPSPEPPPPGAAPPAPGDGLAAADPASAGPAGGGTSDGSPQAPAAQDLGGSDGGAASPAALAVAPAADSSALPAGLPHDGVVDYRVTKGDGEWRSGRGTLRWHIDGDHYRLDLDAHAEGLPALFWWTGVHWSSEGRIAPDRLQPALFMKNATDGVRFDWGAGTATFLPSGFVRPLQDGMQDLLSVFFQFAVRPPNEDSMDFPVTNGDKIDRYAFEMTERTRLKVDLGEFDTVHISRTHKLAENGFEIWLAADRNFLPVQMRLYHARLGVLNLYATGLRVDGLHGRLQEP